MKTKLIEIRDRGTCIVALCIDMNPVNDVEHQGLRAYGYPCNGVPNIMITHSSGGRIATNDPYHWNDRTWRTAHHRIIEEWDTLKDGDVVDVEFALGETTSKKVTERFLMADGADIEGGR